MKKDRTIHFIYTAPRSGNIARRAIDKLISKISFLPPLYRFGYDFLIPWRKPIRAPHSITYHMLQEFKKYGKVKLYSLYEHTVCDVKEDDIVIGVPCQNQKDMPWKKPDYTTVMYRTLEKYPNHKETYIMMPYSNDPLFVGWANEIIEKYGKNLVLLAGKIWLDNWQDSPWKSFPIERKIRVDMGIDPVDYPRVKTSFNPKGKRGFLYVGHTSWYKNIKQLEKIAEALPEYKFGHVGLGKIKGFEQIANFADLNKEFMTELAKTYDCFVNVSWDAQVTTVLEQMCFGFTVACTPESGYTAPDLLPMSITDTEHNVSMLKKYQEMDESELLRISESNRAYASEHHSWKQFCETVIKFIGLSQ